MAFACRATWFALPACAANGSLAEGPTHAAADEQGMAGVSVYAGVRVALGVDARFRWREGQRWDVFVAPCSFKRYTNPISIVATHQHCCPQCRLCTPVHSILSSTNPLSLDLPILLSPWLLHSSANPLPMIPSSLFPPSLFHSSLFHPDSTLGTRV